MGKSAQFPLHVWLPDAMEGPTPVSALIHAATMVAAGVYLSCAPARCSPGADHADVDGVDRRVHRRCSPRSLAVVQTDIKRVLAYSTCSQLGYMVCALGAGSVMGGFFHLMTHAFFKALLFLGAGSVIHAVHSNELSSTWAACARCRMTSDVFVIGALSLAGIPPLRRLLQQGPDPRARCARRAVGARSSLLSPAAFLTAFYMVRVVFLALLRQARRSTPEHAPRARRRP